MHANALTDSSKAVFKLSTSYYYYYYFLQIVSEWMAISGFQETADCVRICQLLPKESERPWNLWLSLSLSLVDKKNSNSGYGFRYFCSWLMAVIARKNVTSNRVMRSKNDHNNNYYYCYKRHL